MNRPQPSCIDDGTPFEPTSRRIAADRLVDLAVVLFALWTMVCHLLIFTGRTPVELLVAAAVLAAAGLSVAAVGGLRRWRGSWAPGPAEVSRLDRGQLAWLVFWALLAMGATATLNRPDVDDSYYLNMAITVADQPQRPLLCCDSLFGRVDLPINPPSSRLRTLELLTGTLAKVTGIDAIRWHHQVLPVLAALCLVLVWARLYRWLTPRRWLWCLGVTILTFLTVADTNAWYSNMAFVRLHQGKAVFVSVVIPLILCLGLEMAQRPSRSAWLRLAAAQIAGLGLNGTATWLAPTVACLALVAGQERWNRRAVQVTLAGALAGFYPLGAGLYLRTVMSQTLRISIEGKSSQDLIFEAVGYVLGWGTLVWVVPAVLLVAWASCRGVGRRVALVFPAGFFLFFFNPYTARWFAEHATGSYVYWRVFWVLPMPALMAMVLTAPLVMDRPASALWLRRLLTGCIIVAFVGWIPGTWMWSVENGVRLAPLELRAGLEREVAAELVRHTQPGAKVLAPVEVSPWITTFHDHPFPLVVRRQYMRTELGRLEIIQRWRMTRWVSGLERRPQTFRLFQRGVYRHGVTGVCFRRGVAEFRKMVVFLTVNGFERKFARWGYEVWTREKPMRERPIIRRMGRHIEDRKALGEVFSERSVEDEDGQ